MAIEFGDKFICDGIYVEIIAIRDVHLIENRYVRVVVFKELGNDFTKCVDLITFINKYERV